jgi:uncharacterized protein (TIGR04141 family)
VNFTIHLIKPNLAITDLISPSTTDGVQDLRLRIGGVDARLLLQPKTPSPPTWAEFFEPYVTQAQLGLVSQSAALLLVPASSRLFAISFGLGRYLLSDDATEKRFGLITTLNSVPSNAIRSIDKASFDSLHRHTRTQANKLATPQEFGLDIEQDLLRAITGVPNDMALGSMMSGYDGLRINVNVTIDQLPALLSDILRQYKSVAYKANFPWIENIAAITDKAATTRLDNQLVSTLNARRYDSIQLVLPEILDWTRIAGFAYGKGRSQLLHADIDIKQWGIERNASSDADLESLHTAAVSAMTDHWEPSYSWSVYRCLYAEIRDQGEDYVFSAGSWYRIQRDFVATVNEGLSRLPIYAGQLPTCNFSTEAAYNEALAKSDPALCLMDRKLIYRGGGRSSIEFCDVFSKSGDLLHLKWYGGSAVLSHLFSQAYVSGELLASDADFRVLVNAKLPTSHRIARPKTRPDVSKYRVVFGIIGFERNITQLPFFSRVNLRSVAARLSGIGYQVAFAGIPLDPTKKALTVVKPRTAKK